MLLLTRSMSKGFFFDLYLDQFEYVINSIQFNSIQWLVSQSAAQKAQIPSTFEYLPYLSEYGQAVCGVSHLGTSKYIYGCCDGGTLYF
jgi:hypothetical protein